MEIDTGSSTDSEEQDLREPAVSLVARAQDEGLTLRLIGGIAVALHCPSASHRALQRQYADIDFVANTGDGRRLDSLFVEVGYYPEKRFNSLHGRRRRLYFDHDHKRQIDVFVSEFSMCHTLPLADRLSIDSPTIPLAELFLSKAQIVEMNRKDMLDLFALLNDHEVADRDSDTINGQVIAVLCGKDWGLWRTLIGTLEKLEASVEAVSAAGLSEDTLRDRLAAVRSAVNRGPTTMKWRTRAKIGDRIQWYELPEDPRRGPGS
jgi:hypothetical protein